MKCVRPGASLCGLIFKESWFSYELATFFQKTLVSKIHLKLGIVNVQKKENKTTE